METINKLAMANKQRSMASALLVILYVYGLVLAKGFWGMFFAIIVPFYSWYLSVESLAKYFGLGV